MISFPLYFFLIVYLICVGVFAVLFLLSFSHLLHFKAFSFTSFIVTATTIVALMLNLLFTAQNISTVRWDENFTIGEAPSAQTLLDQ